MQLHLLNLFIHKLGASTDDTRQMIDKIPTLKDDYEKLVNNITIKDIIKNLDPREKKVIVLRYYKEQTQANVGKILGITQVQVSRIEKKILNKMKDKLEAI